MSDWLSDVRLDLLAAADEALQLLTLMREEATRGKAPETLLADLDRLYSAAQNFRTQAVELDSRDINRQNPSQLKELFSQVRHDMLTPVGQLIGYCELLDEELEPPWDTTFRDDLNQLLGAARTIQARIDDLLQSRIGVEPVTRRDEHETVLAPMSARPDRQPGHILVVDDSELNRHLLSRWLTREGHTVGFAQDGAEALQQVRQEPFDLILLDVIMPRLNGYDTLCKLKSDRKLQHIPVVMISALSEFDRVARCIAIGAEDYLSKPFDLILLRARIGACLEKKRLRDREMDHLRQIEREKKRYNELLHLMLPAEVVTELKERGSFKSREYPGVAVMFADIVGFTRFCDAHSPEEVVSLLQGLVAQFEAVAEDFQVQKIKTIGDSFMSVAGLLRPVDNPTESCVRCAEKMLKVAKAIPPYWDLRIGIHVGPVVAGLLGNRYDLFDLWGDTVNTAARVEQHGIVGAITLTATAWEKIADQAEGEPRGRVEVKGKGSIEMVRFLHFRP